MTPGQHLPLKAQRLIADKRVTPLGTTASYRVDSESGNTYTVTVGEGWARCDCAALRERCTHVMAVEVVDAFMLANDVRGVAA